MNGKRLLHATSSSPQCILAQMLGFVRQGEIPINNRLDTICMIIVRMPEPMQCASLATRCLALKECCLKDLKRSFYKMKFVLFRTKHWALDSIHIPDHANRTIDRKIIGVATIKILAAFVANLIEQIGIHRLDRSHQLGLLFNGNILRPKIMKVLRANAKEKPNCITNLLVVVSIDKERRRREKPYCVISQYLARDITKPFFSRFNSFEILAFSFRIGMEICVSLLEAIRNPFIEIRNRSRHITQSISFGVAA